MEMENEFLKITITPNGGSFTSIYDKKRNKEILYQPIKESWSGQDVFIFPMVARLKNGTYTIDNKEYHLKNHGLIRYMKGEEIKSENEIHILFKDNLDSRALYPFSFEAESIYKIINNEIVVTYRIKNKSNKEMPYMVGGHPAFMLDGIKKEDHFSIKGNYLTFDGEKELIRITQEDTCSFNINDEYYKLTDRINLSKDMFKKINTYIFKAENINSITLNKIDNTKITIKKDGIKYLALWSGNEWGNFIAIEPWNGLPDYLDCDSEFKNKKGVSILKPEEEYLFTYSIVIE